MNQSHLFIREFVRFGVFKKKDQFKEILKLQNENILIENSADILKWKNELNKSTGNNFVQLPAQFLIECIFIALLDCIGIYIFYISLYLYLVTLLFIEEVN